MTSGVKLMPVSNLLKKEFFIRSYQRGYRWTEDQLRDLLNDFKEFIDRSDKHEEEFYCLQPIVVKQLSEQELAKFENFKFDTDYVFEVIDGQQRITTITILLKYLSTALKDQVLLNDFPKITYQVRPKSKLILSNFNEYFLSSEHADELMDNIDFYHMKRVYLAIAEWFEKQQSYHLPFLKLLTAYKMHCVKVIWYEVSPLENSIEVFRRFNAGKISLSNAELIKALFLQEDVAASHAVKYSISKEWQHIENQLQSDFFWGFLNPKKDYTSRIEYIFDLLFEVERKLLKTAALENFDNEFGKDKHKVFRYFSSIIEKSNDLTPIWDRVNNVFEKFTQWFHDARHYHYIGYLQNMEGIRKNQDAIVDILTHSNNKGIGFLTKQHLTDYLQNSIQATVGKYFENKRVKLTYKSPQSELRNLFFLFNVETCARLSGSADKSDIYKLPFNLNKDINYDIEHIDSKTDKDISTLKPKEQIAYLQDVDLDFGHELDDSFTTILESIFVNADAENKWSDDNINSDRVTDVLNKVHAMLEDLLNRGSDNIKDRDLIGNLTLLNDTINRSYGNAYFNTKRRLIIEEDINGTYIPISTKNVFLKYYSGQVKKHTRWGEDDARNYQLIIEDTLANFA